MSVRAAVAAFIASFTRVSDDPYYNNVGFLLHMDGAAASTSVTDSGPLAKVFAMTGTGALSATSPARGTALYWSPAGSANRIAMTSAMTGVTASGATPWTFECMVWPQDFAVSRVLIDVNNSNVNTTGWNIYIWTDGKVNIWSGTQGTSYGGGPSLVAQQWNPIAVTWDGTVLRIYVNGNLGYTSPTGFPNVWGNQLLLGNSAFQNQAYLGGMDEVRFTSGVARYTGANYSVSPKAFPDNGPDPYYSLVGSLLHFNGAQGSTTIKDEKGLAWTAGGAAQLSATQSKFGGSALVLNGTTDYLSGPVDPTFDLGTITASSNATFECWGRWNVVDAGQRQIVAHALPGGNGAGIGGWDFYEFGGRLAFSFSTRGPNTVAGWFARWQTNAAAITAGVWIHVAAVLHNGVPRVFVNGVEQAGAWLTGTNFGSTAIGMDTARTNYGLRLGASDVDAAHPTPASFFGGYIDEARWTKGIARYTANFTPAAGPFGGAPGDTSFANVALLTHFEGVNGAVAAVDVKGHALTFVGDAKLDNTAPLLGGTSLKLDGAGDYVTAPGTDFVMGAADFTVEAWVKTSTLKEMEIVDYYNGTGTWQLELTSAGLLRWYSSPGGASSTGSKNVADGAAHHVAACRVAGTMRLFVDGVVQTSFADSINYSTSVALLTIGAQGALRNSSYDFNGWIDDVRVTKGVGRYAAAFTPLVAPFSDTP